MTTVSFTVNDAFVPRIIAAMTDSFPAIMQAAPNQAAGAKAVVIAWLTELVSNYEATLASGTGDALNQNMVTLQQQWQTTHQAQRVKTQTDARGNIS